MNPVATTFPDTLRLTDPLPVLPVPFWREPAFYIIVGTVLALAVTAFFIVRLLRRPKRPDAASVARAALTGGVAPAQVTRALRDYLAARVPELHTGLTHEELAARAGTLPGEKWEPLLAACDEAVFSGKSAPDLAAEAGLLVTETESRFTQKNRRR